MSYRPHHTAISVRNLDKTMKFYGAFGFEQVHRYDDPDKVGVKLRLQDYVLELFAYKQNEDASALVMAIGNDLPQIGMKHIGLTVDNLDAALDELKSIGIANESTTIMSKGTARFFFVQDPDGMWVEVITDNRY